MWPSLGFGPAEWQGLLPTSQIVLLASLESTFWWSRWSWRFSFETSWNRLSPTVSQLNREGPKDFSRYPNSWTNQFGNTRFCQFQIPWRKYISYWLQQFNKRPVFGLCWSLCSVCWSQCSVSSSQDFPAFPGDLLVSLALDSIDTKVGMGRAVDRCPFGWNNTQHSPRGRWQMLSFDTSEALGKALLYSICLLFSFFFGAAVQHVQPSDRKKEWLYGSTMMDGRPLATQWDKHLHDLLRIVEAECPLRFPKAEFVKGLCLIS
jgi:hypothetical protein